MAYPNAIFICFPIVLVCFVLLQRYLFIERRRSDFHFPCILFSSFAIAAQIPVFFGAWDVSHGFAAGVVMFGFSIYYYVMSEKHHTSDFSCPKCGHETLSDYCEKCGTQMKAPVQRCPKCNRECHDDNKYCGACGTALK